MRTTTLAEAIEQYLAGRTARHADSTVKNEAFVLRRFAAWYGPTIQVRNMRSEKVEAWFTELRSPHVTRDRVHREPIAASTFNYYRVRLASLFRWMTRRGLLKADLLAEVDPLPVKRRKRLQPAPSILMDLPRHTDNARDRALVALLTHTALRRGSALALKVRDVDLDEGWLAVQVTKSHLEDTFPISADLEPELRLWLREYAKALQRPLTGEEHLFPARTASVYTWLTQEDGTKTRGRKEGHWVPERKMVHPERVVQRALRSAGVEIGVGEGCHTLRRAFARAMFDSLKEQGHDGAIKAVGAMLHHVNSATTEIYLGLSQEVERRNDLMRGKPLLSQMVKPDAEVINLR